MCTLGAVKLHPGQKLFKLVLPVLRLDVPEAHGIPLVVFGQLSAVSIFSSVQWQ